MKEELKQKREKLVDVMKGREEAEGRLGLVTGRREEEVETSLEKANRESEDSRMVIKKTKGEVERLRKRYNERENEWGEKLHIDLGNRGELLRDSESKFECLVK